MFSQSWKMYLTDIKKQSSAVAEEKISVSKYLFHTLLIKTLWMLLKADSRQKSKTVQTFWITWK